MNKIWYKTGITKIAFVLTVHRWIVEAVAKFSVYGRGQVEDSFFIWVLIQPSAWGCSLLQHHWWWKLVSCAGTEARRCCIGTWRKQSLVCHVLNIISAMCFQLKLVAWCFCRLTIGWAVHEVQSGHIIHRIIHTFVIHHVVLHYLSRAVPFSSNNSFNKCMYETLNELMYEPASQ